MKRGAYLTKHICFDKISKEMVYMIFSFWNCKGVF